MERQTVIITGANSGIGKAAARQIAARGHTVVLACRDPERAERARREIGGDCRVAQLDLARRRSVHDFTDWARRELGGVDVLINNAADFDLSKTEREMTPDGFEKIWFTNHLAPVLLVDRLMDLLVASPQGRIINVSSKGLLVHPFLTVDRNDPMFANRPFSVAKAYYQSKLAQIMHALWLARQLTGTMVTANCVQVASVKFDKALPADLPLWMKRAHAVKQRFAIAPERMAETYARAALDDGLKNFSGELVEHPFKVVRPSAYARDPHSVALVMDLTYKQLGIGPAVSYEDPAFD